MRWIDRLIFVYRPTLPTWLKNMFKKKEPGTGLKLQYESQTCYTPIHHSDFHTLSLDVNCESIKQRVSGCRAHVNRAALPSLNELMGILFSIFSSLFGNSTASIVGYSGIMRLCCWYWSYQGLRKLHCVARSYISIVFVKAKSWCEEKSHKPGEQSISLK